MNEKSSIFDYIFFIISKILEKKILNNENTNIKYEIFVKSPEISIYNCYKILNFQEERIKLIEYGKECCESII
jgi:hypothetical protein